MSRASVETASIPVSSRDELIDSVTVYSCLKNCMGSPGVASGCCALGTRDYIIGPIPDADALLKRLSKHFGRDVPYDEVFIDYEEGSKLFPERDIWQQKENFPAIRVNEKDESLPCMFLADDNLCSIHEVRSVTCRNYTCDHVKNLIAAL